jgi:hypothetical protein
MGATVFVSVAQSFSREFSHHSFGFLMRIAASRANLSQRFFKLLDPIHFAALRMQPAIRSIVFPHLLMVQLSFHALVNPCRNGDPLAVPESSSVQAVRLGLV